MLVITQDKSLQQGPPETQVLDINILTNITSQMVCVTFQSATKTGMTLYIVYHNIRINILGYNLSFIHFDHFFNWKIFIQK